MPPYTMSVGEATALLWTMEVPGGTSAGTPTAAPPFVTFGWGELNVQGRLHVAHLTYKLFNPRARRCAPTSSSA